MRKSSNKHLRVKHWCWQSFQSTSKALISLLYKKKKSTKNSFLSVFRKTLQTLFLPLAEIICTPKIFETFPSLKKKKSHVK